MSRTGFTIIEVLIVIALISVLVAFGLPRYKEWLLHESMRSARRQTTTHLARARVIAIHRGCRAVLHFDKATSHVWVTACPVQGAGVDTVGTVDNLSQRFGVTFDSVGDSVLFTPQGIAFATSSVEVTFYKAGYSKLLEITPVGRPVW